MGIILLRCDDRLIHGQCIVKVLNDYKLQHIILVDAFTASNPVMSNIYKMAVPDSIGIDVADPVSAVEKIVEYAGREEVTMVLVKDPIVALELMKMSDKLPKALNIGPMSNRKHTKKAAFYSFLLEGECDACAELESMGVRVFFQQVPGEKEIEWEEAKSKM